MNSSIQDLIIQIEPLEPETLLQLHPELTDIQREQIFVLRTIKHTNFVHEDLDVFENAVQVLNGILPDVNKTELVKPAWIWRALEKIKKLRPNQEFSWEVIKYIDFVMKENGIKFFPQIPGCEENDKRAAYLEKVIAESKKELLGEDELGIQAYRYLYIKYYLENK